MALVKSKGGSGKLTSSPSPRISGLPSWSPCWFFWASPSYMPKYNTYDRISQNLPPWLLGIPQPAEMTGKSLLA